MFLSVWVLHIIAAGDCVFAAFGMITGAKIYKILGSILQFYILKYKLKYNTLQTVADRVHRYAGVQKNNCFYVSVQLNKKLSSKQNQTSLSQTWQWCFGKFFN